MKKSAFLLGLVAIASLCLTACGNSKDFTMSFDEAYDIARDLLTNGSTIPSDIVYQAQFRQGSYVYKQIGNTYFCGK